MTCNTWQLSDTPLLQVQMQLHHTYALVLPHIIIAPLTVTPCIHPHLCFSDDPSQCDWSRLTYVVCTENLKDGDVDLAPHLRKAAEVSANRCWYRVPSSGHSTAGVPVQPGNRDPGDSAEQSCWEFEGRRHGRLATPAQSSRGQCGAVQMWVQGTIHRAVISNGAVEIWKQGCSPWRLSRT